MWYAIRNKRTRQLVAGTDFRYPIGKRRHFYADEYKAPMIFTENDVAREFKRRGMSQKTFEIVRVAIVCDPMIPEE